MVTPASAIGMIRQRSRSVRSGMSVPWQHPRPPKLSMIRPMTGGPASRQVTHTDPMDRRASFLPDPPLSAEVAAEYEADVTGDGYVNNLTQSAKGESVRAGTRTCRCEAVQA
jgi:hypothetical protein